MSGISDSMVIASISAWCTPTMLFCFMNLIIATIFIASKNTNTKHHDNNLQWNSFGPITRVSVSSFLDRVKSLNLSTTTTAGAGAGAGVDSEHEYQSHSQPQTPTYSSLSRLAQSIHFLTSDETQTSALRSSKSSPPEFSTGQLVNSVNSTESPGQLGRVTSFLDRVKSFRISPGFSSGEPENGETNSDQIFNSPGQLGRVTSIFARVKSFRISSGFSSGEPENVEGLNPRRSEKTPVKKKVVEMKKSRSEMRIASDDDDEDVDVRRPATARAARNASDEEFDLKADDFISRFKQQLKLQRVESLVRYRDMLNRGT